MCKSLFAVFVLFLFAANIAAQNEAINWQTDYKAALAAARKSEKPLMVDFSAKWCKPCQVMDERFWTRADVIEAAKSFVPLKLDYDSEKNLAKHFAVRGLPYVAFADAFGSLVTFRGGYGSFKAEDIVRIAEAMPDDFNVLSEAFNRVELKKNDAAALLEIADYYGKHNMPIAGGRYYQLAFDAPETKRDASKRERIAAEIGRQFCAAESFYQAAFAFEDYLKLFGEGANKESVYADLTGVYARIKMPDKAEKILERLKAEFPSSTRIGAATQAIEQARRAKGGTPKL